MSDDDATKAEEIVRRLHIVNEEACAGAEEAGISVGLLTVAVVGADVRIYGNVQGDELRGLLSAILARLDEPAVS